MSDFSIIHTVRCLSILCFIGYVIYICRRDKFKPKLKDAFSLFIPNRKLLGLDKKNVRKR